MRNKPRVAKQQVREVIDVWEIVARWAKMALQLSVIAFFVSLAYILYGVFSGALNQGASDRVLDNLRLMGQILTVASLVGTAAFAFLSEEIAYTVAVGLVGIALMFGSPVLLSNSLQGNAGEAAAVIGEWTRNASLAIFTVVGIRLFYEIIQQIRTAGDRRRERESQEEISPIKKAKKMGGGVWSPCWGLPYCHDAVREHCPAFKARKSCWRFGYGCNCDPSLIEQLIRSGALETGKTTATQGSKQRVAQEAYVRSDLQADRVVRASERTIPCTKCPIYLDHQRQKFKIVNPIAIVAALIGMAIAYKPLLVIYTLVVKTTATLASRLTFGPNRDAGQWFEYLNTPAVQVFFFIIVGLLALAYVLKFVEWAIFVKKL
jgi:hypothetical protein